MKDVTGWKSCDQLCGSSQYEMNKYLLLSLCQFTYSQLLSEVAMLELDACFFIAYGLACSFMSRSLWMN